ncbi:MAG TPA: CDP-alcohol phosphatidyltransferase family protein [Saprospiraceae bacterium]|nr:CDP-alcohol phosphatidyltransferase family protein [Saprospiraceae bacterium]
MWKFKEFNIADWFSFYRIGASPVLGLLLLLGYRDWFAWMLFISYSTDAIDGFVARRLKICSSRGSELDSLGDQITFTLGLLGVLRFESQFILDHWIWIVIAFAPYLIQMGLAFYKYGKTTAFHTYLAKSSAIAQSAFILGILFFGPVMWLFWLMIGLGIIETLEEITLIFLYDKWVAGVKGIYWALKDPRRFADDQELNS